MSDKITKSARFSPEWAKRVDMLAALDVEFPDGVTSVLQEGVEAMWKKYGNLAGVMQEAVRKVRQGEREMDEKITKIAAKEIEIDGEMATADLIIENAGGKWYGVDLGDGDWDYLQDNGEYIWAP